MYDDSFKNVDGFDKDLELLCDLSRTAVPLKLLGEEFDLGLQTDTRAHIDRVARRHHVHFEFERSEEGNAVRVSDKCWAKVKDICHRYWNAVHKTHEAVLA